MSMQPDIDATGRQATSVPLDQAFRHGSVSISPSNRYPALSDSPGLKVQNIFDSWLSCLQMSNTEFSPRPLDP